MLNRSRIKQPDNHSSPSPLSCSTKSVMAVSNSENLLTCILELLTFFAHHIKPLDVISQANLRKQILVLKSLNPENQGKFHEILKISISRNKQKTSQNNPSCLSNNFRALPNRTSRNQGFNTKSVDLETNSFSQLDSFGKGLNSKDLNSQSLSPNQTFYSKKIFQQVIEQAIEKSNVIEKLPKIVKKATCGLCKNEINSKSQGGKNIIRCKGHYVCNDCRTKKIFTGENHCPMCGRKYTDEENYKLKMKNNSVELNTSLLKAVSFIDSL